MTPRQREVLVRMRDSEDGELVYSKGQCWIGYERVAPRTLFALLRMIAVSMDKCSKVGECERYHINEIGRELIDAETTEGQKP